MCASDESKTPLARLVSSLSSAWSEKIHRRTQKLSLNTR